MKNPLSVLGRGVAMGALGLFLLSCPSLTHAAGSLTANLTTANQYGINDQTDAISTTTAAAAQTLATRTLTVNSLPSASTTSTIGSCVVTYSSTVTASSSCASNAAIINIGTSNTATLVATALHALTNVSDNVNGHGALAITGTGTTAIFTTSGNEASTTAINFVDGTSAAVSSTASTPGVVGAAEVLAVTFGGTVDTGDLFNIGMPTPETAAYTTQSTDTTLANIATGMYNDILSAGNYSTLPFTVATSSAKVVFTAKVIGTTFDLTSLSVNSTPTAQVVKFTPSGVSGSENYTATINGSAYTYGDTTGIFADVLGSIATALAPATTTTCASNSTLVTCTAKVAGTPFTFSATTSTYVPTNNVETGSGGGFSGGGGGGGGGFTSTPVVTSANVVTTPVVTTTNPVTTTTTTSTSSKTGASSITKTLKYGMENNSVKVLQTLLATQPTLGFTSKVTGYFGLKTEAAVEAFQVKYDVVAPGAAGYGTVGPKTRKALVTVFGS